MFLAEGKLNVVDFFSLSYYFEGNNVLKEFVDVFY